MTRLVFASGEREVERLFLGGSSVWLEREKKIVYLKEISPPQLLFGCVALMSQVPVGLESGS